MLLHRVLVVVLFVNEIHSVLAAIAALLQVPLFAIHSPYLSLFCLSMKYIQGLRPLLPLLLWLVVVGELP